MQHGGVAANTIASQQESYGFYPKLQQAFLC